MTQTIVAPSGAKKRTASRFRYVVVAEQESAVSGMNVLYRTNEFGRATARLRKDRNRFRAGTSVFVFDLTEGKVVAS